MADRLTPGTHLGRYEIVESLGAGGMGEVYRAHDPRLERDVALKVLAGDVADDPERLRRFQREARILARLSHPNIVTVHSVEEADGFHFLTMELVEGRTLADVVPSGGLPQKRFLEIAIPLADAVAAAHSQGVVHRDLKPGNVMVDADGRVMVLDFGLARAVPNGGDALSSLSTQTLEQLTREGQILGTMPYMAPEQLQGGPATVRSDIFSLGSVFYRMATGERPFAGESGADLVSAILRDRPASVSEVRTELPRQLGRIVGRCLEKDPQRRFQTALDVRNELEQLRDEVASARGAGVDSSPGSRDRPGWLIGSLATAVIVLLGLVLWALVTGRQPGTGSVGDEATEFRSLVVLPATVHGPQGDAYLADAIPGTLSTELTGIEGLEIKAPPRAAELEGRKLGTERIARLYGVDVLVQPAVTAEGNRFLLTLQLVEAADRSLLWSARYRGSREGYLDLVERAAVELQHRLRPGREVASVAGLTASSEAELTFRQGKYHSNQFNMVRRPEDLEAARGAFRRALDLDPEMAEAAAEMAFLCWLQVEEGQIEALDELERWADRALDIDPRASLAQVDLSWAAALRGRSAVSLRHALEAVASDPTAARAHSAVGVRLFRAGLAGIGVHATREAIRLDPLYLPARAALAGNLNYLGRRLEALDVVEETLEIEPREVFARLMRIQLFLDLGRLEEARMALDEPAISDFGRYTRRGFRARLALQEGSATPRAAAEEYLRILRESQHLYVAIWTVAAVHAFSTDVPGEVLLELLEEIERQGRTPIQHGTLLRLSAHPTLGERAEFRAMLHRARARLEEVLEILTETREEGKLPGYLEGPLDDALREHPI